MHICLNLAGGPQWMGGIIYTQNLARAIASLSPDERHSLKISISTPASKAHYVEPVRHCVDQIYVQPQLKRAYLKLCKILANRVTVIPQEWLNPDQVDFIYPTIAGSRAPYKWGGLIPDFQAYHLPEFFTPELIENCKAWHKVVSQSASVAVFSSEVARKDFEHFYPESEVPTEVLHFATSPEADWFDPNPIEVQHKYNLPDHFFLVCNQFWKHKDHAVVIEALDILREKGQQPCVVCTGKTEDPRNPDFFEQLISKIESSGLQDQVKILGLVPRMDQIQLMRRCLAVIQPSRYEGWSTVVEDARTMGKPMIISDFPVHLEQNPPYSYFFSQGNPQGLAAVLQKATTELEPGPNSTIEAMVRGENLDRVQQFGRRFLEIAYTATQT